MTRFERIVLDAVQLCGPKATIGGEIIPFISQRTFFFWPSTLYKALYRLEEMKLVFSMWAYMPEPRIRLYSAANSVFDPDHIFYAMTYSTDDGEKHPVGLYSCEEYANQVRDAGIRAGFKGSFYTIHHVTQEHYLFQQWIRILGMDMSVPYIRSLRDPAKPWTMEHEEMARALL